MPATRSPGRPPYDVIAVFDETGDKPSFAYTTGVFAAYGGPELFIWATPDEGVDPGEQWMLSNADQHAELTTAVERLREIGTLEDGESWDRSLDGGRSVLRVTVVPAEGGLPTFAVPPGAAVRRLHLALVRPPIGAPTPLTAAAAATLERQVQAWAQVLTRSTARVSTDLDQRYGPGTCGILLLFRMLLDGPEEQDFTVANVELGSDGGTSAADAELDAVARTAGRREWVRQARDDIDSLLAERFGRLDEDGLELVEGRTDTAFRTAGTAWVLRDLIDDELFRRATASVRAFLTRSGAPEDAEPAPPARLAQVRRLAQAIAAGQVAPPDDAYTLDGLRAVWRLAWSGRGGALTEVTRAADVGGLLNDTRAWQLLAAALVLDLVPDLAILLPVAYRTE